MKKLYAIENEKATLLKMPRHAQVYRRTVSVGCAYTRGTLIYHSI